MTAITFITTRTPRQVPNDDANGCGQNCGPEQGAALDFATLFGSEGGAPAVETTEATDPAIEPVADTTGDATALADNAINAIMALHVSPGDGGQQPVLPSPASVPQPGTASLPTPSLAAGNPLDHNRLQPGDLFAVRATSAEPQPFDAAALASRVQTWLIGREADTKQPQPALAALAESTVTSPPPAATPAATSAMAIATLSAVSPTSKALGATTEATKDGTSGKLPTAAVTASTLGALTAAAAADAAPSGDNTDQDGPQQNAEPDVDVRAPLSSSNDVTFSLAAGAQPASRQMLPTSGQLPHPSQNAAEIASALGQTEAWLDGLSQDIATMTSEHSSLKFRIAPRTLGEIDIEVQNSADKTSVYLSATNTTALTALQEAQPRLIADARHAGLAELQAHFTTKQGQSDNGRSRGQRHNRNQDTPEIRSNSDQKNPAIPGQPGRINDRFA